jgi:hypothetical protein
MLRIAKADKVLYPPGTVNDLIAGGLNTSAQTFEIRFTAPGGELDSGKVDSYTIYYSLNMSKLMNSALLDKVEKITEYYLANNSAILQPAESGTAITLLIKTDKFTRSDSPAQYFFRLKAFAGELTSVSNIARLYMGKYTWPYQSSGLTSGAIAGIVIGTMLTVLLVLGAGYWYRTKILSK